jgi:hypothetical protein
MVGAAGCSDADGLLRALAGKCSAMAVACARDAGLKIVHDLKGSLAVLRGKCALSA